MSARSHRILGTWRGNQHSFRDDRLVVSVKEGFPVESTLFDIVGLVQSRLHTAPEMTNPQGRRWAVLRFPPVADAANRIPQLASEIAADERIRYAEPAFLGQGAIQPDVTLETEYPNQTWPARIDLPGAWVLTNGDAGVLLAIIDSGISIEAGTDPDHPDLSGARYIVRYGTAKQDYVDDDDVPQDDHCEGHGTHVTGIASASGDNKTGTAGVNWVSNVYIARVIEPNNDFTSENLKLAVQDLLAYATALKIDRVVVNMSLEIGIDLDHLKEMCEDANEFDGKILFCCASEVSGLSRTEIQYPAAYAADYPFIMTVAATEGTTVPAEDVISDPLGMDSYDAVDIFAPGLEVHSTLPTYARDCKDDEGVPLPEAVQTDYGTRSGTSMATPMVAGVASLMWGLNKDLTAAQIIACMRTTADEFTYNKKTRDAAGAVISEVETAHRRLNASNAVASALWSIEPRDSHLEFANVPVDTPEEQAVVFDVECSHRLTLEVVAGSDALLPAPLKVAPMSGAYDPTTGSEFDGIKVTYTPTASGDISYGEFRIRCTETEQEWTIYITASAATTEAIGVVLVADRSGSMAQASGIDAMTRMEVLQESVGILVDTMRVGDALGVVGFSSDVDEPSAFAEITATTNRDAIKGDIATMVPGGATSIGGGVERGVDVLAGAAQPHRAMIVLTDGQENTPPFVADVMPTVDVPVYAIGMGTAEVLQPAPLEALTAATGAYLELTGTLDERERYRVAKYILQMFTDITGDSVVLDPAGTLRPRQAIPIPFTLCEDDRQCSVTLMTPAPRLVRMVILSPDGTEVADGAFIRIVGQNVLSHRFALPVARAHGGTWRAVLSIAGEAEELVLREHSHAAGRRIPSLPYQLIVTAKSSLMMQCRVLATSSDPGATVRLRATITRRGLAYDSHTQVQVFVRTGDQSGKKIALRRTMAGVFEGSFVASQTGVHQCLFRATGLISGGQRFCREQTMTAHTWRPGLPQTDLNRARSRESDRRES